MKQLASPLAVERPANLQLAGGGGRSAIPTPAGIQKEDVPVVWIPACAGMTSRGAGMIQRPPHPNPLPRWGEGGILDSHLRGNDTRAFAQAVTHAARE